MNISSIHQNSLYSLRQALGIATIRKAMNQDANTVTNLLKGMKVANQTNRASLEHSNYPHKGRNIDISV